MSGGTSSGSGSIAGGGTSLNAITTAVDTLDWPRVEKAWPAPAEWVLETLRLQKHNTCVYMCCPEIRKATPPFALQLPPFPAGGEPPPGGLGGLGLLQRPRAVLRQAARWRQGLP